MQNQRYDLEERVCKFGEAVIKLAKQNQKDVVTTPIISQFVRAGTSIGANYMEANGASSKKDFRNKVHICKKEAMETKYWLRMLAEACPQYKEQSGELWREAQELSMIFAKIAVSSK